VRSSFARSARLRSGGFRGPNNRLIVAPNARSAQRDTCPDPHRVESNGAKREAPRIRGAHLLVVHCRPNYRFIVDPGAGTDDGIPPGVDTVGLVPVAEPLFIPVVLFPPFVPVVPAPVEPLTLPDEPAAPVAAAPPVPPPPAAPPACASAIDELIARIEARIAVVIFMLFCLG
jgi:hypothetical protein